jgi:hypothetical protein
MHDCTLQQTLKWSLRMTNLRTNTLASPFHSTPFSVLFSQYLRALPGVWQQELKINIKPTNQCFTVLNHKDCRSTKSRSQRVVLMVRGSDIMVGLVWLGEEGWIFRQPLICYLSYLIAEFMALLN